MIERLGSLPHLLAALWRVRLPRPPGCPVCSGLDLRIRAVTRQRYLLQCRSCDHIFAGATPGSPVLQRLHGREHLRTIETALRCPQDPRAWEGWKSWKLTLLLSVGLAELERSIEGRPEALDIGCGHGKLLEVLLARGWSCTGLDFSDAIHDLPLRPGIRIIPADFEHDRPPGPRFHLVTMTHVLEHFSDPLRALERARGCLQDRGRLLIEVPLFIETDDIRHQGFFSRRSLRLLVQRTQMAILKEQTYRDQLNPQRENLVVLCGRRSGKDMG